ncbi:MAG: 2OG-Fe(II) oxygenase [Imperialibacter sp.]|uniref:2OG-Fe(II) oxygenase n=1 Tax=Imperialibacter sp. TaxID=2038411 RepID=UPI0032EE964E
MPVMNLADNAENLQATLLSQGFVHLESVLTQEQCEAIMAWYTEPSLFRTTINMARYRFGEGEYKYFNYPLPDQLQSLRQQLYEILVPAANLWSKALRLNLIFPDSHADFLKLCHDKGQRRPTPLLLTYGDGGYNTLHQDLYGDVYFPFQPVFFLKQPGWDYEGGEFILAEQRPRAQSKAVSLTPKQGDLIIFATSQRPVMGSKGYYRVQMRHGVSTVHSGHRMTLGIPLHDAK